jgi:hypothetical protein
MLGIPWAPEPALPDDTGCDTTVGCGDGGVGDISPVFVGEGGIGPFPGYDTSSAAPKLDERLFNPGGPKAWHV